MSQFTLEEIVQATGGQLLRGDSQLVLRGVATDTRAIRAGEIFIALKGDTFDGHHFLAAAGKAGAIAAVVAAGGDAPPGMALVRVEDTLQALGDIARFHRQRFTGPVIGITGSNGKTTTKDLVAAVLAQEKEIVKTEANFNNEIGLPLTLLKIGAATEITVVEMGMRGLGQIQKLAEIARPNIGIITNVGLTHLEILGSQANIASAKSELAAALPEGGIAILNGDDPWVRSMNTGPGVKRVYYGRETDGLDYRAVAIRHTANGSEFLAVSKGINIEIAIRLPLPGQHNIYNAMAAVALACELGIGPAHIQAGLAEPDLTGGRLKIIQRKGYSIIDDTYNASPTSVQGALEVLSRSGPGRKIAVLADMLELGPEAAALHRQIGQFAAEHGVDYLLSYGELASEYVAAFDGISRGHGEYFSDKAQLIARLLALAQPGDHILVKGSRGMKMEEIVTELTGEGTIAPCHS